jgi:putative endonuclease
MHYVYVLRSLTDDGFYIGYTANLRKRFEQHLKGNSFTTSYRGPWELIYYEAYIEQADALGRERYLKRSAGRRFFESSAKALSGGESNQIPLCDAT